MLARALIDRGAELEPLMPELRDALTRLDDAGNLTLPQGTMLAAATLALRPQVILDLGTGGGNSATAFGIAGRGFGTRVYTFDRVPAWEASHRHKLAPETAASLEPVVNAVVGDIAAVDYAPIVGSANAVIVFWDAHGYTIADRVLSHLMPLIADRPHVVICHDMSDSRFEAPGPYNGQPFWRAVDGANDDASTAFATIGPVTTRVEQAIPLVDFCWRNQMELRFFDWELRRVIDDGSRVAALQRLGLPTVGTFNMAYFTMNETARRFFPGHP
jgi:hypothetical protein